MSFHVPNQYRVRSGLMGSDASAGNNGAFFVSRRLGKVPLKVIASDGLGWEHVSVSLPHRCPTWEEMAAIKALFWDANDCVVQFHPPESEYVNNHPYCLHLWRSTHVPFPLPDSLLVGYKELTPQQIAVMTDEQRLPAIDMAADTAEQRSGS